MHRLPVASNSISAIRMSRTPLSFPRLPAEHKRTPLRAVALQALLASLAFLPLHAQPAPAPTMAKERRAFSEFSNWWGGKEFTGDWFGLRDTLKDNGFSFSGRYYGAFFGVVDSQRGSRGFWDQGVEFAGSLDFGKAFRVSGLEGLRAFAQIRWRDDRKTANPNEFVEAPGMFNPSGWISGVQWRLNQFGLEYDSGNLLPVKNLFCLRGGWLMPQREFVDQPLSRLFLNGAVSSAKGIGGNIPFTSSFSTWGGTLQIKPFSWQYTKLGLFMAYPKASIYSNHGLAMQGYGPDTSLNGLMAMGEIGLTPKIGPSELPGRYAVGGYYWGNEKKSHNGTAHFGQFGFYWQADQMLFREPLSRDNPDPSPRPGQADDPKSLKAPVPLAQPELSEQGLGTFHFVSFAPPYNNTFPFYFQSGLVYRGLLPGRDNDQAMLALACANYSYDSNLERRENGEPWQNFTLFLECGYRFEINSWAFLQPFVQYVVRPNGTDDVQNATILGFATGVKF